MKIPFPFDFPDNRSTFMRQAGYAMFTDPNTGVSSYVKRLTRDYYPRMHVYLETNKDNQQSINLHLDQKKPSYAGAHAHNAEYEGGVVAEEGQRLAGLVKNRMDNWRQALNNQPTKPQGFFAKLFK